MIESKNCISKLTNREFEVLRELVMTGNLKDTSKNLKISLRTVESHLTNLKEKLNIKYKYQLNKLFISTFYVKKSNFN